MVCQSVVSVCDEAHSKILTSDNLEAHSMSRLDYDNNKSETESHNCYRV